jgi:hypothetical protein
MEYVVVYLPAGAEHGPFSLGGLWQNVHGLLVKWLDIRRFIY